MRRLAAVLTSVVMLITLTPGATAQEEQGEQRENPWRNVQAWETATVHRVVDGDTVVVTDEVTGVRSRIRILGINAPELPTSAMPGNCGGAAADRYMRELLPVGTRVRLLSADRASTGLNDRPQRVVLAYNPLSGEFDLDVAWALAEAGWAVWFTAPREAAMSSLYRAVIEGAQQRRVGIWNPELCGAIEQPEASLTMRITRGDGGVRDESVTVRNTGGSTVDISGWMLRAAGNAGWYTFPGGSVLNPGDIRVVHTGRGRDRRPNGYDLYRNRARELYVDPGREPNLVGNGTYLLDRAGNFRSWREYPCTERCDPPSEAGSIVIDDLNLGRQRGKKRAQSQFIRFINQGTEQRCLDGYRLQTEGFTYWFPSGTCLAPGATYTLHGGKRKSWSGITYLNRNRPMFYLNGSARIITDRDQVLAERFW